MHVKFTRGLREIDEGFHAAQEVESSPHLLHTRRHNHLRRIGQQLLRRHVD